MPATSTETPGALGYRMPAEWEPHAATWLSWPRRRCGSFRPAFDRILPTFRALVAALIESEPVCIAISNLAHEKAARRILRGLPMRRIAFHRIPTNEPWCRDYGPIFVTKNAGPHRLAITDWDYCRDGKLPRYDRDHAVPARVGKILELPVFSPRLNLEGGAIDVNGEGALLTSEGCQLHRTPHRSRKEIEAHLRAYLGVRQILWLGHGIAGDEAHGHIDTLARFVSAKTIVAMVEQDRSDANHAPLRNNLARLRRMGMEILPMPMPRKVERRGFRLPASYANFYIANRCVLVPTYADANDAAALSILRECFPNRAIVGIDCRELIWGLGSLHCLTQQQPAINTPAKSALL